MRSARHAYFLFAVAIQLSFPSAGRADLLPLTFVGTPDILANDALPGTLLYSSSSGELTSMSSPLQITADAFTATLGSPGPFFFDNGSALSIDLYVDQMGNFVANPAATGVSLQGGITLNGDDIIGTLLSGKVTNFGAASDGSAVNGIFVVTGGAFTSPITLSGGGTIPALFYVGELVGFLDPNEGFFAGPMNPPGTPFDFTQDFGFYDKPELDPVVPEPASLALGLVGGGIFWWVQHRRRRPHRCRSLG